jgi:predicted amidohydrolase
MPRKVRVVTTSGFSAEAPLGDNRDKALTLVEMAGQSGADLICLPEGFLGRQDKGALESLQGRTFDALAERARRYGLWVVAGLYAPSETGGVENCAVAISRRGELAGCYLKVHPTIGECEAGVVPGAAPLVVETDFGRLGLAICYDINWPAHWRDLALLGAELVVWPSAYDGGSPLSYYAWAHDYHVVSSVRTAYSKIIDVAGRVEASTTLWHSWASKVIDLEQELFHADYNEERLPKVEAELGAKVTANCFDEERYFTLESNDPEWPMARLKAHYGLEGLRDYCARAARVQDQLRATGRLAPTGTNHGAGQK